MSFYPRPWAKPDDVKLLDDPKESVNITLGKILDSTVKITIIFYP